MVKKIKIEKKTLIAVFIILGFLILIAGYSFINKSNILKINPTELDGQTLEAKFAVLNNANTNFCAGADILQKTNAERLQGSCCSPMDFHRYEEQVEGLKKYSYIKEIPEDPYDISKVWAEKFLDHQKNIQLTEKQQQVYDEAMNMSMEGGPCCCKCWRWYAFEGLAKYLITEYDFDSKQIAEVWDLEDGCGGSGHVSHGTEVERTTFEPEF